MGKGVLSFHSTALNESDVAMTPKVVVLRRAKDGIGRMIYLSKVE